MKNESFCGTLGISSVADDYAHPDVRRSHVKAQRLRSLNAKIKAEETECPSFAQGLLQRSPRKKKRSFRHR